MFKITKARIYEEIAQAMFRTLKKTHPDLSIEKAKAIIHGMLEEKWFLSLKREQIEKVKKNIFHFLEIHELVGEEELSDFINKNIKSSI